MTESHHPSRAPKPDADVLLRRMRSLSACPPAVEALLRGVAERTERAAVKATLQLEGQPTGRPRYVLSGWACRLRYFPDGRRQIFTLVLPGDGVGVCLRPHPLAMTTTVALTPMVLGDAAPLMRSETLDVPELRRLLEAADDLEEHRLLDALMRMGRLTALERVSHLMLELHDRLASVGLAREGRFPLPTTQEVLADSLGLSVVHVNRTLQELRRQSLLVLERGAAHLPDRAALADIALQAASG